MKAITIKKELIDVPGPFPVFYKNNLDCCIGFYSEDKVIVVMNGKHHQFINRGDIGCVFDAGSYLNGTKITEHEFNKNITEAIFKMCAVEVCIGKNESIQPVFAEPNFVTNESY